MADPRCEAMSIVLADPCREERSVLLADPPHEGVLTWLDADECCKEGSILSVADLYIEAVSIVLADPCLEGVPALLSPVFTAAVCWGEGSILLVHKPLCMVLADPRCEALLTDTACDKVSMILLTDSPSEEVSMSPVSDVYWEAGSILLAVGDSSLEAVSMVLADPSRERVVPLAKLMCEKVSILLTALDCGAVSILLVAPCLELVPVVLADPECDPVSGVQADPCHDAVSTSLTFPSCGVVFILSRWLVSDPRWDTEPVQWLLAKCSLPCCDSTSEAKWLWGRLCLSTSPLWLCGRSSSESPPAEESRELL